MIPVVVRTSAGAHVAGLRKQDFTVLEGGKPQSLVLFEETKASPSTYPVKTEPGEITNAITEGPRPQRVTILVLDMLNTPFESQASARAELIKYVASSLDAREPTVLLALHNRGLSVLQGFTTDPRALLDALRVTSGQTPNLAASSGIEIGISTEAIKAAAVTANIDPASPYGQSVVQAAEQLLLFRESVETAVVNEQRRIAITLQTFQQISQAYAGVPGRKALIWVTAGFPFEISDSGALQVPGVFSEGTATQLRYLPGPRYDRTGAMPTLPETSSLAQGNDLSLLRPLFERTEQILTSANISIYPVDARGLVVYATGAERSSINRGLEKELRDRQLTAVASMNAIAAATGGKAFHDRNDLGNAVRAALSENETYYTLGYYRNSQDVKPGFRKLVVKVAQPAVEVRAKKGYMIPQDAAHSKLGRQVDLGAALSSPLDFTAAPIFMRWKGEPTVDKKTGKKQLAFQLWLPPDPSAVGISSVDMEIIAVATNLKGERADTFLQSVGASFSPETVAQVRKLGINYDGNLLLSSGKYVVKFIIRDLGTGKVGSLTTPIDVR
ncbi:MAG: VWA domain-containing protein [Acidobacteriales bacterium]|nr:VWA domain-containing protein [Terriglobales bacterium]